jgi:alpha-ketoglutarate-dependent taurine dioxygenase
MRTGTIDMPSIGTVQLRPMSTEVGVDVEVTRLGAFIDQPGFMATMREALGKYLVLRFRRLDLQPDEIERLIRGFGPPMDIRSVKDALHVPGHDYIQVLSNGRDQDGKPLGDDNSSAQIWHTDAGQWEVPPGAVILYGRVVPNPAPKTYFKSMIHIYESLPSALKQRIANLSAVHHKYPRSVDIEVHRNSASLPLEHRSRGKAHPLVRRHAATRRPDPRCGATVENVTP